MKNLLVLSSLLFLLASQSVSGFSGLISQVPNGSVNSCSTCHGSGFSLNDFGVSFDDNGRQWDAVLAAIDSDGDSFTNGQELGDPDGDLTPIAGAQVTNPGDASSFPVPTNDPLIGGTPVAGHEGWFLSDWFGYYNTTSAPWIFHNEHGWLYRAPSSTNADTYFYDDAMGAWWYTNETDYPYIYSFDPPADSGGLNIGSAWLFYNEGTVNPRTFYILTGPSAGSSLSFNP